jgi:hypothetical protein
MEQKQRLVITIAGLIFITACNLATVTPTPQAILSSPTAPTPTPPPPATATQTLTSTPFPKYFTEEFNSDLAPWEFFQTGGANSATVNLENSLFAIYITSPHTWYYAIHSANEYSTVNISAKVDGNTDGSIGLVCYYSESKGWYEFNISSDRTYSVLFGQWLAGGIAKYTPLKNNSSGSLEAGRITYEIGLTCQEKTLILYINGNPFGKVDVTRYGLTEGKVGITASSFEEIPMTVFFDWMKVGEK